MFVTPGTAPNLGYKLTREAADKVSRNWSVLLLNGLLLIVAGVLVFSIDWSVRSLATFLGALFIAQGVAGALTQGIDSRINRINVFSGLLSVAVGIAIIAWPSPGIVAVAIVLGSWLIVSGSLAIAGAFAARSVLPDWWLVLILGLLEVPLGVLALATPGATLAALITVAGIWAVAIGVTRIALAFDVKSLPGQVDKAFAPTATATNGNGNGRHAAAPPAVTGNA
jgi:uncharacterized membrane protein HdeD (DUF308 family)